jgi:cell wall-associated NlpC family hydrolase
MIANDISFCLALIGKPWISGAGGPDSFDCWGLLRFVLRELRGVTLSEYGGVRETGLARMLRTASIELPNWEALAKPVHLCGVAMSSGRRIEHVGLWIADGNGGILHCHESAGVVFQSVAGIRQTGFQNITYYQLRQ